MVSKSKGDSSPLFSSFSLFKLARFIMEASPFAKNIKVYLLLCLQRGPITLCSRRRERLSPSKVPARRSILREIPQARQRCSKC